jgi:hypothetical protein
MRVSTLAAMEPRGRTTTFAFLRSTLLLCAFLLMGVGSAHATSLSVFVVVFGQATNEIAMIEGAFDNSTAQKEKLARLVRAREVILNPELRDDRALAALVDLLGNYSDYDTTMDESAANARAQAFDVYNLLGVRVEELPPSQRATLAQNRFDGLAPDANALAISQHAQGISSLLTPFVRQLEAVRALADRAAQMPVPRMGRNSVRAQVDGRRFKSRGDGRHSANEFEVNAPDSLYWEVSCRAVDGERVITFTLPVLTDEVRYEVAQGLAGLTYTEDAFAPDAVAVNATSGTFFVQRDRDEVYGVFSAAGPGFEITNGRFRIKLPRALRGED